MMPSESFYSTNGQLAEQLLISDRQRGREVRDNEGRWFSLAHPSLSDGGQ